MEPTSSPSPVSQEPDRFLPISILVAAILISGSLIYVNGPRANSGAPTNGDANGNGNGNQAAIADVSEIRERDVILGEPDAKVTIVQYGDYQCPFCASLYKGAEQQIREDYVKTGKVRLVYREFPLESIHPQARAASEAAECAKDQGKFWVYHDALFDRQDELPTLNYVTLAGELGMDTAKFKTCVDSRQYQEAVSKSLEEGEKYGVSGTPASFVNGRAVSGAQPYAVFKALIDDLLAS